MGMIIHLIRAYEWPLVAPPQGERLYRRAGGPRRTLDRMLTGVYLTFFPPQGNDLLDELVDPSDRVMEVDVPVYAAGVLHRLATNEPSFLHSCAQDLTHEQRYAIEAAFRQPHEGR